MNSLTHKVSGQNHAARCRHSSRRPDRRGAVKTQALFGWGKKQDTSDKDEQFRMQQELLEMRRTGGAIKEANARRQKVAEVVAERKAARKSERDALARGEMPESLGKWKNYANKDDAEGTSGIVVPLLPFGMRKYDEGERFDLRSPYADDGWVDPEETDAWAGFKKIGEKLLNFSGKSKQEERKPIIWASQYEKTMAAKKAAKQQQK